MTNSNKKELPSGWSECGFNHIANVVMGQSPPSSTYNKNGKGLPFFQGKAEFQALFPRIDKYCSKPNKIAQKGSVLMSVRAPVGPTNIAPEKCCIGRGLAAFHALGGISSRYLLYLIRSIEREIAKDGTGTTFSAINKQYIEEVRFGLPPLNEQHRIVAKIEELFSELDKGVESLKQAREQLKVYRQALLKHAFEGKLTEQWRKENADKLETAEQLLKRIKREREARYQQQLEEWKAAVEQWEKDGKIGKRPSKPKNLPEVQIKNIDKSNTPDGWALVKALYISDFITKGTTPEKNELLSGKGEIPFIKVYNLTTNGKLDFSIEPTFVSKSIHSGFLNRSKCKPGDILMNIVGPPLGKVSLIPNTHPEWNINQAIVRYRTNIIEGNYLSNYLLSEGVVRSMIKKSKATAGQFNLTLEICRDLIIPVCSISEQKEINTLLDDRFSVIDKLESDIEDNIARSEALRQSILKKAFSGQLVPQDSNDEPASALLERIAREKAEATAKKDRGVKKSQKI